MRSTTTYARIALFILGVNALGMAAIPAADPSWDGPLFFFLLDGQILLLVLWAALGAAPWYFRWPWLGGIAWLLWRPWPIASDGEGFWRHATLTMILPHALTVLTLSCLLRALRRIIVADTTAPEATASRQFNLRTMFAWTAGVAVLLSAWQRLVALQTGLLQLAVARHGETLVGIIGLLVAHAVVDLALATAILQRPKLGFSIERFFRGVLIGGTSVLISALWPAFDWALGTTALDGLRPFYLCAEFYLLPVVAGLLLARAAGYRLAWAGGALDRIAPQSLAKRSAGEDMDMI